jgi:phosphate transport system protein
MPRETLDRQIHQLQDEVLLLGSMVEQATSDAVDALNRRDQERARCIYNNDQQINEKRFAIENATLILIATQQPMAHDLRFLAAILEVITELERMGDYAKGIAKIVVRLKDDNVILPSREFTRMTELAVTMLHQALSAFITEDTQLALSIPPQDTEVDDLYNKVYHRLVTDMIANPETIDRTNLLMWVSHNLERMADRVINICERTIFIATGELSELASSDEEDKLEADNC